MSILDSTKPYIIGETAYLHQGDFDYLISMIDEIAEAGLQAIKFHLLLNPCSYLQAKHPLVNKVKEWCFSAKQWSEIIRKSEQTGLDVIALCDDVESVEYLLKEHKQIFSIELHASGINDYYLLESLTNYEGIIILGIGGTALDEIQHAIESLNVKGKDQIMLMYGFQSYPTDYNLINLSKMQKLKDLFGYPIGYADHTAYDDSNNVMISCMAANMGFHVLEKHFTLDHGVERIDYHAAVGREQMLKIKELMGIALRVYGSGLKMSKAELDYGKVGPLKKAVVARKPIKKGEKLTIDNLWFKRTIEETPMMQSQFIKLIGLKAVKNIQKDEIVDFSKVVYDVKHQDLESFTNIKED